MGYRFNSMIAIMRNSIKTHKKECCIPGNKFCFKVLSLLRYQGLILGFNLDTRPSKKSWRGYPKYNIMFKYRGFNDSVIKGFKFFKNTRSNFYFININRRILDPLKKRKLFLINSRKGLVLLSMENFMLLYKNRKFRGKLILEILI